jgi:energy-converting hydrogenase Eha subunit A
MSIEQEAAETPGAAFAPVVNGQPHLLAAPPAPIQIIQPYPYFAHSTVPMRKSRALGLASMIAAIVLGAVSTLAAAIIGASINGLNPSHSDSATLVIGWLMGTALGVPVLALGIVAIPLNRGRVFGMIAVSLALAAPIVSYVVIAITAALVQGV